jgi:hypothetical protein
MIPRVALSLFAAVAIAAPASAGPPPPVSAPGGGAPQVAQAAASVLVPGTPATGALGSGDDALRSGEWVDWYDLVVAAGDSVTLDLESGDFDAYLLLRGAGVSEDNDDRGDGTTHAAITATFATGGTVRVGVTTYRPGEAGTYTLRATSAGAATRRAAPQASGALPSEGAVAGELDARDARDARGSRAEAWTLELGAGDAAVVTMRSDAFDTWLTVEGPGGFRQHSDDAPGIGTNSRVVVEAPESGTYSVTASAFSRDGLGAYTLDVGRPRGGVVSGMSGAVTAGGDEVFMGTLADGDAQLTGGEYYDVHELHGRAGDRIEISLTSTDFDPYVILSGHGLTLENDDSGDGSLNSALSATLPADGVYSVLVTSYAAGETGAWELRITPSAGIGGATSADAGALTPGETRTGRLELGDGSDAFGRFFDVYRYESPGGERLVVDLESDAFDTVLTLRSPSGIEESNDDRGDGTLHSRVSIPSAAAGTWTITATSYSAGAGGEYRLTLRAGELGQPVDDSFVAEGEPLTVGQTVSGTLADSDAQLGTGEFIDTWVIEAAAGDGVTVTIESPDFDTYLLARGPDGFSVDNDDANGTNSQAELTFPVDGRYEISVTSYAPGEIGAYTLRVEEGTRVQRAARGRVYGVFAGITDYAESSDLPYCAEDAVKLEESLDATGLLASQSVVLTDSAATIDAVRNALARVAQRAGPDDLVLFFWSGHGNQQASTSEIDGNDETLVLYDGEVTDDEFSTWLDPIEARMTLVALDSCFSGGFARDVVDAPNRMGIFSSEEDVTSNVAGRFAAGGYLSYFLRSALEGAADTDPIDGIVTAGELSQYLRRQWAQHMMAEAVETFSGELAWQNLVIERGSVKVSDIVLYGLDGASAR